MKKKINTYKVEFRVNDIFVSWSNLTLREAKETKRKMGKYVKIFITKEVFL